MNPAAPVVRAATAADLPALVAAADAVFRTPARPGLPGMATSNPLLFDPDNAGRLLLAVERADGRERILAHAGFTLRSVWLAGHPGRVACFGAVFAVAERRGGGLGSLVFAAAVERARQAGAELGLVSGTRGLYRRAGFTPYPLCRRYRVSAGAPIAAAATVFPYGEGALADLVRLQAAEPTRFVRSQEDWRRLVGSGVVAYHPGRVFLVGRPGERSACAYLALAVPIDPAARPRALELGGDRRAVADGIPALAQALGATEIDLVLPPHDDSLESLAAERGWPAEAIAPLGCSFQRWNTALEALPLPFYGLDYV